MSIKRLAIAAVGLIALLTMAVGLAGAGSYTTNLESPAFSTTFDGGLGWPAGTVGQRTELGGPNQNGWHSAVPGNIPALPTGYDQQVVNNSTYGGQNPATADPTGPDFGTQSLRVSNYITEKTAEFYFQTYSAPTPDPAGESTTNPTNTVFDGSFDFISTSANVQEGLQVSVSPDNGSGGRMSYVGLTDTAEGIDIVFYETDTNGNFVGYDVGTYSRTEKHTIRFLIQTVPGEANDIVQLFVDGEDIGVRLQVCFTTWEQWYRVGEGHQPGVIDSFEFRADNSAGSDDCDLNGATMVDLGPGLATCVVSNLDPTDATAPHGYLFDNVSTVTRNTDGPSTVCGVPEVGKITPTGTTCQQYRDGTASTLGQVLYTTKGDVINSVSPGVFFYYTQVSGDKDQTVSIIQSNKESNDSEYASPIPIQQGQVFLYDATTCTKVRWTPTIDGGNATGELPSDGDFIIGVKYNASDLKGLEPPGSPPVTYSFKTELDDTLVDTGATVELASKK